MGDQAVYSKPIALPICVDLDGTLIYTDMLFEIIVAALRGKHWLCILKIPLWLLKGRSFLKHQLAQHVTFNAALLPYNKKLIKYLKQKKAEGHAIVLVTASDEKVANSVADHLGLFSEVLASNIQQNLKGEKKADLLVKRYGENEYIYAGNAAVDFSVWSKAKSAIVVYPSIAFKNRVESLLPVDYAVSNIRNIGVLILKSMRIYQWVKNILVFIVPFAAHAIFNADIIRLTSIVFISFSLSASGTYIINDLLDLESDRQHPRKRHRPFASGLLPIIYGLVIGPLLISLGILVSIYISPLTSIIIGIYLILTIAYSFSIKTKPLIDVFCLAILYTLRLIGGGVATNIDISIWLLSFSGFMFLGLAILKRTAELLALKKKNLRTQNRRGYSTVDITILQTSGIASAFISCVVLSLYVDSGIARHLYNKYIVLWAIVPLMLFWQLHMWRMTLLNKMHDDPIIYASKDNVSRWVFVLIMLTFLLST